MLRSVLIRILLLQCLATFVLAISSQEPINGEKHLSYTAGQAIPVTCLNRTIDTGEHIMDAQGHLQYVPFPTCNETGKPLELYFGVEKGTSNLPNPSTRKMNCTIDFITDEFFHLLEFYVHNDAPLTCRIPSRPLPPMRSLSESSTTVGGQDTSSDYIPLIFALTGTLQLSHLHVANNLNVLLHASPKSVAPGVIDAATAYSVSHTTKNQRVIIGDSLPLRFSIRWYPNTQLPSGWTGMGGHLYLSTVVYCLLSAGAATAICVAYFRGVELPRRLRSHGRDRTFGDSGRFSGAYGGYGVGNGYGYVPGKRD